MKTKHGWSLGICSWSLQCDIAGTADCMKKLGLRHIHLDLRPGIGKSGKAYIKEVLKQKWTVTSTMIGFPQEDYSTLAAIRRTGGVAPDDAWPSNKRIFRKAVELTETLGVDRISMHAGFIDHRDRKYFRKFCDRVRSLADIAGECGIDVLLETGQESAKDLNDFLIGLDCSNLKVNFDPANMILYDKDEPADAVRILAPWIGHVHIKDAVRTRKAGTWGSEVQWGKGEVGCVKFLNALKRAGFKGALAVEREAGDSRFEDIETAVKMLT